VRTNEVESCSIQVAKNKAYYLLTTAALVAAALEVASDAAVYLRQVSKA